MLTLTTSQIVTLRDFLEQCLGAEGVELPLDDLKVMRVLAERLLVLAERQPAPFQRLLAPAKRLTLELPIDDLQTVCELLESAQNKVRGSADRLLARGQLSTATLYSRPQAVAKTDLLTAVRQTDLLLMGKREITKLLTSKKLKKKALEKVQYMRRSFNRISRALPRSPAAPQPRAPCPFVVAAL